MTDEKTTHKCELDSPYRPYGPAILEVFEDDEGLWAENGEYCSQVNYCPVCGYEAKKKIIAARAALGKKE
jgi:hypothetical protein